MDFETSSARRYRPPIDGQRLVDLHGNVPGRQRVRHHYRLAHPRGRPRSRRARHNLLGMRAQRGAGSPRPMPSCCRRKDLTYRTSATPSMDGSHRRHLDRLRWADPLQGARSWKCGRRRRPRQRQAERIGQPLVRAPPWKVYTFISTPRPAGHRRSDDVTVARVQSARSGGDA